AGATSIPKGYEHWLVKFTARDDASDAAALELCYAQMAARAGLDVPKSRLLRLDRKRTCFAVKRFDRIGDARVHVHTIGGLLHADHRLPSLDYLDLLKATSSLTRDQRQVMEVF